MKVNKILAAILVIGVLAAGFLAFGRARTENQYKNYEVTMDLEEIKKIAATEGKTLEQSLADWKEAGLDSVTITESSLDTLKWNNDFKVRTSFEGYDVIVEANKEGIDFVEKGLKEVLADGRSLTRRSDTTLVLTGIASDFAFKYEVVRDFLEKKIGTDKVGQMSKLQLVGLGYIPAEIEAVQAVGLAVRFRPAYSAGVQDAKRSIDRFIAAVKQYSRQSYAIFFGDTILGMDTDPAYMMNALRENEIAVAMIEASVQREHLEQVGLEALVRGLDYQAVRVFSTWNYIQRRYDYSMPLHHQGQEIVNTFYRAITERNIRVIFFKPFIDPQNNLVSDYAVYKARFADLERRLLAAPHHIRRLSAADGEKLELMPRLRPRPAYQMLAALAVIACFLLLIENMLAVKPIILYGLFALAALPTAAVYLLHIRLNLFNILFGLAATILFAVLAVQFVLAESKQGFDAGAAVTKPGAFGRSLWLLAGAVLISLSGALCETAFYAESEYLLELKVFTGVKISQLLPLVLVILVALRYFGNDILGKAELTAKERTLYFLNMNIKFWHALIGMMLLAAVALLIIRSGHETGVQPANMELFIRNILEEVLPARPRNKAFLLGYPGVLLLGYFAYQKRYRWLYPILAIMAAMGQANILNTFSHIRTPLYLSFLRIFFEILFAIGMTGVYVLVLEAVGALWKRHQTSRRKQMTK